MGRYDRWTEEEDNRLIELYNAGLSYKQIGEKLNRTHRSINTRVTRLGKKGLLKPRKTLKTPKNYYEYDVSNIENLTPSGAYFIILVLCEAHLLQRKVNFGFRKRDVFDFRELIAHILKMNHSPHVIWEKGPSGEPDFSGKIFLHSKTLVSLLKRYNVPIGKKAGLIKIPNEILNSENPKIHGAILRSAYESEGSANKKDNSPHIVIGNSSKTFLKGLSKICNKYGIEKSIYDIRFVIRGLRSLLKYYEMAYSVFDFPYYVKAKKGEFEDLIKCKWNMGCKYTHIFNEIIFEEVLRELIKLRFIKKYDYKNLSEWLKKNYKKSVNESVICEWLKPEKILRVFGKTKEEIIKEKKGI